MTDAALAHITGYGCGVVAEMMMDFFNGMGRSRRRNAHNWGLLVKGHRGWHINYLSKVGILPELTDRRRMPPGQLL